MHMSDALISPAVGGVTWAISTGLVGYSIKKINSEKFNKKLPLMGVMGAFLFATQMINFSIPGTGSSGHIGGGLLLAIILGSGSGFLTLACVLLIQSLFFADGGILAFGCNLINLGFFTSYIGYPLIFKNIVKVKHSKKRVFVGAILASIVGLQLGSLGVVLETVISGQTELPFSMFLLFMQPIHLVIGIVEGIITAIVVLYIYSQNSQLLDSATEANNFKLSQIIITILIGTLIIGGGLSLLASNSPDGLEWSIFNVLGSEELKSGSSIVMFFENLQNKISPMADYEISSVNTNTGTTISGIIGSLLTLLLSILIALIVRYRKKQVKTVE